MSLHRTLAFAAQLLAAVSLVAGTALAREYRIDAAAGNDANPGTDVQPLKTYAPLSGPGKRFDLAPGDVVAFGAGVHRQETTGALALQAQGTAEAPITIRSIPGAHAIIDGSRTQWTQNTLQITGSHIVVCDLEFQNACMGAIGISGAASNIVLRDLRIHDSQWQAVTITSHDVDTVRIERVEAFHNCRQNAKADGTALKHDAGWPSCLSLGGRHVTVADCHIYENWGEGVGFYGIGQRIEGCRIHDNFSVNIYINNVADSVCERNFCYTTFNRRFYRGYGPNLAPAVTVELASEGPYLANNSNNRIVNNILVGGHAPLFYWAARGEPLVDTVIAHNTLVGAPGSMAVLKFDGNQHTNVVVANNLFVQGGAAAMAMVGGSTGMTWAQNLWLGAAPPSEAVGAGDVSGDPLLVNAGGLDPDDYRLASDQSPACDAGMMVAGITNDFAGGARPLGRAPDLGAFECDGVVRGRRAASPAITPADGTWPAPLSVALSCPTPGVTLRYTLDGSPPTAGNGTTYAGPFALGGTGGVQTVVVTTTASATGYEESRPAAATYRVGPAATAPVLNPPPGMFAAPVTVTITPPPGASASYTLGSAPSATLDGEGTVALASSMELQAFAHAPGLLYSTTTGGLYRIAGLYVDFAMEDNGKTKWRAKITIRNDTDEALDAWTLSFPLSPGVSLTSVPGTVTWTQDEDGRVRIQNRPGKVPLACGQPVSITVRGTQSGPQNPPDTFEVNGREAHTRRR